MDRYLQMELFKTMNSVSESQREKFSRVWRR